LRRLRRLIRELRPDLIHTSLAEADLLGRIAGRLEHVPVVSSLVNVQYGPEHLQDPHVVGWKLRMWQVADIATARFVRRFHAVSEDVADVMAKRLMVSRRLIDVVPRGRDPDALGPPSSRRRALARDLLGIGNDELILAIGRQAHQKGFDILIESLADLSHSRPRVQLWIAGAPGAESHALTAQITRLNLSASVRLLGHRDDIPDLLAAADVFVLPSRREGSPGALIEAMAMSVACVASDVNTVREVAGSPPVVRLVPPGSPSLLATAVGELLADPRGARELGSRARDRFLDRYTVGRSAEELTSFYRHALHGVQVAP
jgi:glycosyltransferase involved in cell wall biosynthesis